MRCKLTVMIDKPMLFIHPAQNLSALLPIARLPLSSYVTLPIPPFVLLFVCSLNVLPLNLFALMFKKAKPR